jgi:uncharacterized Zn-finger protein
LSQRLDGYPKAVPLSPGEALPARLFHFPLSLSDEPLFRKTIMADPKTIEVTARELPVRCPPIGTAAWTQHPRVYLDVLQTGKAVCPYCGTCYALKGKAPASH